MKGFSRVQLSEIVSIKGGKRLPLGENFSIEKTSHPYIRARDIGNGNIKIQEAVYLSDKMAQKLSSYTVNTGDVCITIVGANVGEMGVVPQELSGANLTENAVRIKSTGKIGQGFLKYTLLTEDAMAQMKVLVGGAAQPKLGIYKIQTIEIPLPPLSTQGKITTILSAYDDLIENNQRRIKILEETTQNIYREWFVKFRFPGHEKVKKVDSTLGMIPEGWEIKKVQEIVRRLKPEMVYKQSDVKPYGKTIVIDQSRDTFLGFHDNKPDLLATSDDPIIIFGDHTCKMQLMVTPFSIGPNVVPFIANNKMSIYYLYYLIHDLVETKEYKRHWNELVGKEIIYSDSSIIKQFDFQMRTIFEQNETLKNVNLNLRRTRDMLLPKLISGEIDVSDLDIRIEEVA